MKRTNLVLIFLMVGMSLLLSFSPLLAQTDDKNEDAGRPTSEENAGGFTMSGAIGATVIDGVSYQYFSFRPDIPIWKFGIGLDVGLYFNPEGQIREEDWDEEKDIIEKIRYLRYGKPGQKFFVRAGALSPISLGYGLVMRRYTNDLEWPQVRRIGLQTEVNRPNLRVKALLNNFRELETSVGLVGGRIAFKTPVKFLPLWVGATVMHDGNQYLGAKDDDGDGIPDRQDMYPGDTDAVKIAELVGIIPDPAIRQQLIDGGFIPDVHHLPQSIDDRGDGKVTEFCLDLGLPLIEKKRLNLWVYAQAAQIDGYGRGYTIPGVKLSMNLLQNLGLRSTAELRIFEEKFLGDFFNYSYEVERVTWNEGDQDYIPKAKTLDNIPAAQGFYADLGLDLLGWVDVFGAYQQMSYNSDLPNKSFYSTAKLLKIDLIPKIDILEGYYQQPNVVKLFKTKSDGTVIGFRIGATMTEGVMLVYDNRTVYYNGEGTKIMTIETVITFK